MRSVYLYMGLNPETMHVNQEKGVLHTTAYSVCCAVKGILFFLMLIHESIVYWASKIADVDIVHTISSHD